MAGSLRAGTGEVSAPFAGEERAFRIRLGEIRRIEAKCGVGIGEVCRRLARATFVLAKVSGLEALASGLEIHADDVRETLYQGLVGGGMATGPAFKLVSTEVDDRGWRGLTDNIDTALLVLMGSQETPEAPGEQQAGPMETPTPPNLPNSDGSTASEPPSDSAPDKSTS